MSLRALAAAGSVALVASAGCAIVGFDLGGYGPAASGGSSASSGSGGAGGAGMSSSHHASSSTGAGNGGSGGGTDDCGPASVCADLAPAGFSGPVALYVGAAVETCAGDYPSSAWKGGRSPSGAPATCSTCSCDTAACTGFNQIISHSDNACTLTTGNVYSFPVSSPPGCSGVSAGSGTHLTMTGATTSGACAPNQVQVSTTPASFAEQSIACSPIQAGASCGANRACFPAPVAPFEPTLCVFAEGNVACPAGYTKEPALFADVVDDRSCSGCKCGPPAAHCPASATLYTDAQCTSPDGIIGTSSGCTNVGAGFLSTIITTSTPCAPSGGMPTGSVSGTQRATFCCK